MITPVIIHTHSSPRKIPKCPHCSKDLEGWSEPCNPKEVMVAVSIVVFLIIQFVSGLMGAMDGSFDKKCEPAFTKRHHYVVPLYNLSCHAVLWLKEDVGGKRDRDY